MPTRATGPAQDGSSSGNGLDSRPSVHIGEVYLIHRPQHPNRPATILQTRTGKQGVLEAYISYLGADKRLDTWVPQASVGQRHELDPRPSSLPGPSQAALALASTPSATVPAGPSQPPTSAPSTPEREHATMTRVRNFEDVRFGEYLIKTWYYSPYPNPAILDERAEERASSHLPRVKQVQGNKRRKLEAMPDRMSELGGRQRSPEKVGHAVKDPSGGRHRYSKNGVVHEGVNGHTTQGVDAMRGRLWVCDLCFKYMRNRASWERHITSCDMMEPPGQRVYQKGSYTLWEIDGALAPLYCQNLSLFGKLFIDHKSVFFYVENFLFYVLCDAATSRRDQVMAFFSKEKVSYDDYNLACIITFPPFQNRGFGKLMIEFSYYLTLHPSTRPLSLSPGTPERPLSDLGLKGYTAYWTSIILRFCRQALADAPPLLAPTTSSPSKSQRARRSIIVIKKPKISVETINGIEITKSTDAQGQYSISLTLSELAKACHLRLDDVTDTLAQLGFLRYRRQTSGAAADAAGVGREEWTDVEVVVSRNDVDREWERWKVRPAAVLDESCVLL